MDDLAVQKKQKVMGRFWLVFLVLLPLGIYFFLFFYTQQNAPFWPWSDEIYLLDVLQRSLDAPHWWQKTQLLFARHNEHRILTTRLLAALSHATTGQVHYGFLAFCGNLSLLGVGVVLYRVFQKYALSLSYFLPIPFLLFPLSHFDNTFFGLAGPENFGVIFWAFWFHWLLATSQPRSWAFFLSLSVAFMACFSNGNGLVVLVSGTAILAIQGRFRDWLWLFVFGCFCAFVHLSNYAFPAHPVRFSIWFKLEAGFAFLGSLINVSPDERGFHLAALMGLILSGLSAWTLWKKRADFPKNVLPFLVGSFLLIGLTAFAWAFSKGEDGPQFAVTSRYKIYSAVFFPLVYLTLLVGWARRQFLAVSLGLSVVLFGLSAYFWLPKIMSRYDYIQAFEYNVRANPWYKPTSPDFARLSRLYHTQPLFYEPIAAQLNGPAALKTTHENWPLDTAYVVNNESLQIEDNRSQRWSLRGLSVFFCLKSASNCYLFSAEQRVNPNPLSALKNAQYFLTGFRAEIPFHSLCSGRYEVFLLDAQNKKIKIYSTDYQIDVKEDCSDLKPPSGVRLLVGH